MQINLEKRHLFIILAGIIFLAGTILVVAYGGNTPTTLGHSSGEVMVTSKGADKTLQAAIDSGDFEDTPHVNCVWVSGSPCAAAATTVAICPSGKFTAGSKISGCSADGCSDDTRCRRAEVYCCG